jgi:hypothetical protein
MSLEDRTAEDLAKTGELEEVNKLLWDEFGKARELQTKAIDEFDKALWLTNSGAATITLSYITSAADPTKLQLFGSGIFVLGILSLLLMKFIAETNASRDTERRRIASESFFNKGASMAVFGKIRDKQFGRLALLFKISKATAGVCFLAGCIITLISFYPMVS